MKYSLKSFFFLLMYFITTSAFCQYDYQSTLPFSQSIENNNSYEFINSEESNTSGITCHPNSFWAIDGAGRIEEFSIIGNIVSSSGVILSSSPGRSLMYCNNINDGVFNPTFYQHMFSLATAQNIVMKYNGVNWDTLQTIPALPNGCGGAGNFLYYQSEQIINYDGTNFTPIYSLSSSVADVAVDDLGNVYCFDKSTPEQKLKVISPSGQLIKEYNIDPFVGNAYGCFILNSKIYVGLGNLHKLMPITLSEDSAIVGTPLDMPNVSFSDLASCNAGTPLSAGKKIPAPTFSLYPNPANEFLNIAFKSNVPSEIKIYSYNGALIKTISNNNSNIHLDIRFFSAGIYFIEGKNSYGIFREKFIKM